MKKLNFAAIATLIIGVNFIYPESIFSSGLMRPNDYHKLRCPNDKGMRWKHTGKIKGHKHVCHAQTRRYIGKDRYECLDCRKEKK